jgi:hypothetical protein
MLQTSKAFWESIWKVAKTLYTLKLGGLIPFVFGVLFCFVFSVLTDAILRELISTTGSHLSKNHFKRNCIRLLFSVEMLVYSKTEWRKPTWNTETWISFDNGERFRFLWGGAQMEAFLGQRLRETSGCRRLGFSKGIYFTVGFQLLNPWETD